MIVKTNIKANWDSEVLNGTEKGLVEMLTDVDRRSSVIAPRLTGALVNSRRMRKTGERQYTLSYGSTAVPYARKRHEENNKNPSTIGYLKKAGDAVLRGNTAKYFRGKV